MYVNISSTVLRADSGQPFKILTLTSTQQSKTRPPQLCRLCLDGSGRPVYCTAPDVHVNQRDIFGKLAVLCAPAIQGGHESHLCTCLACQASLKRKIHSSRGRQPG